MALFIFLLISNFKKYYFMSMCECLYLCVLCPCKNTQRTEKCQISWIVWVLGTEPEFSARAASALYHGTICLVPNSNFLLSFGSTRIESRVLGKFCPTELYLPNPLWDKIFNVPLAGLELYYVDQASPELRDPPASVTKCWD